VSKKAKKQQHGATPAVLALEKAGVDFTVRTFEHDPEVADYGDEAAAALDVPTQQICKTLLVDLDGGPHDGQMGVAVVPVTMMLDLKGVATAFGAKKATMADPKAAERSTGYVVGGISPLGQKKRLATVVDTVAASEPVILVSGGRRGFDVQLAPADLVTALDATVAPVGREDLHR
jgi:Cys-tRNA(Pro)/Cys-tRNA(Cys) deacylase